MPNPENIQDHKFEKGRSGNPNGRPKNSITSILKELGEGTILDFRLKIKDKKGKQKTYELDVESFASERGEAKTVNQVIAAQLLNMAARGDINAIKEVLNRTEGIAGKQENGNDENTIPIEEFTKAVVSATGGGIIPRRTGSVDEQHDAT